MEGAQEFFFELSPHESPFRDAGRSVQSSILMVEINCSPHIIKELSIFTTFFATESVLEKCIRQSKWW